MDNSLLAVRGINHKYIVVVEGELKEDEERIRLEYEDCSRKYYYTDKIDIIGAYRGDSFVEDENGLYMLEM